MALTSRLPSYPKILKGECKGKRETKVTNGKQNIETSKYFALQPNPIYIKSDSYLQAQHHFYLCKHFNVEFVLCKQAEY